MDEDGVEGLDDGGGGWWWMRADGTVECREEVVVLSSRQGCCRIEPVVAPQLLAL